MDDGELLQAWGRKRSETAFSELMRRHMDWVLAACRRMVHNQQLAEDVAQAVFLLLAEKAESVADHPSVAGWLHRTAVYAAANARRLEAARRRHERAAAALQPGTIADSTKGETVQELEEAINDLRPDDREVILCRFHRGMTLAEIGAATGTTEEAARKRVHRAINRLQKRMLKTGAALAAVALLAELSAHPASAAPADLTSKIFAAAVGRGVPSPDCQTILQGVQTMLRRTTLINASLGTAAVLLCTAVLAWLLSSKSVAAPPPPPKAPMAVSPATARTLSAEELRAFVRGNTEFALNLYRKLAKGQGNIVTGPISISTALAMAAAGARGETETELAAVLHLPESSREEAMSQLAASLRAAADNDKFDLAVANTLWLDKSLAVKPAFLAALDVGYGARPKLADFRGQSGKAADEINAWASEMTRKKIEKIVSPREIDASTRLVLANALYFKAAWDSPFDPEESVDNAKFFTDEPARMTEAKIKPQKIVMMKQELRAAYIDSEAWQFVLLPYKGQRTAMGILLPRKYDGLADVEDKLTAEFLDNLLKDCREQKVLLGMPRFHIRQHLDLKDTLEAMGIKRAFGRADFSGISESEPLSITHVLHEAVIDVGEEGTEAAAVTVVPAGKGVNLPKIPIITANHPFVFCIVDQETRSVLFVGRLMDPEANDGPIK